MLDYAIIDLSPTDPPSQTPMMCFGELLRLEQVRAQFRRSRQANKQQGIQTTRLRKSPRRVGEVLGVTLII